jgi:hypothetical protein
MEITLNPAHHHIRMGISMENGEKRYKPLSTALCNHEETPH